MTFNGFVYHLDIDYSGGHDAGIYEKASDRVSEEINNSPDYLQDQYRIVEDEYTVTATLTDTVDTTCPLCGTTYNSTVASQSDIPHEAESCIGDHRIYIHN